MDISSFFFFVHEIHENLKWHYFLFLFLALFEHQISILKKQYMKIHHVCKLHNIAKPKNKNTMTIYDQKLNQIKESSFPLATKRPN